MHPYRFTVALPAILAFAAPALAADAGVPVRNGNSVQAEIAPSGDEDCFALPLVKGGRFTVKVVLPKGSTFLPRLRLRDPGGDEINVDSLVRGGGTLKLLLKNFPVPETGVWSVCVRGEASTVGTYTIAFSTKSPPKFLEAGVVVPAAGDASFEAAGIDGAVLGFVVKELLGPPVGGASVRDPGDQDVPAGTIVRKGKVLKGKGFVLDRGFGIYSVLVDGSGTGDTTVNGTVIVKVPKPDRTLRVLGPEPRPTAISPPTGVGGTACILAGTGFAPGATVTFDEVPATGVVVDSPTQIRCNAPAGPAADAGLAVEVVVVNPDGQSDAVPNPFQYIGPPKITSVTPAFTPLEGGLTHTVNGSGFRPGFTLLLGGEAPDAITLVSSAQITFVGKPRAEGSYALTVTDELDRTGSLGSALTYVGPPTLASVSPASAAFTGGRTIRVTGTKLRNGMRVFVDGVEAAGVSATGTTLLAFAMPAGPAGTFDLTVRDEFDREVTLPASLSRRGPFVDRSATAVPAAPAGADFFGSSLALGDVDGDGTRADLLVSSTYPRYDSATYGYFPASWTLVNGGSLSFADTTAAALPGFAPAYDFGQANAVVLGDLDGNAGDEAILSLAYPLYYPSGVFLRNSTYYAYYYGYGIDYPTYGATRVLANGGSGVFSDATATAVPSSGSTPVYGFGERFQADASVLGDLDGDLKADLFLSSTQFVVQGSVTSSATPGSVTYLYEGFVFNPASRLLLGDGAGYFTAGTLLPGPYYFKYYLYGNPYYRIAEDFAGSALALGDLDGDSVDDVVVARSYPRQGYYYNPSNGYYYFYYLDATRILSNDGSGSFSWDPLSVPVAYGITTPGSYDYWQADSVALGDLDDDGDRDIVLGRNRAFYWYDPALTAYRLTPAIRILENDGNGKFTEATGSFLPATSFRTGSSDTILSARSVRSGDIDGDGVPDLVVAGTVYNVYDAGGGFGYYGVLPAGPILSTKVLVNDGSGNLTDRTAQWLPGPVNGDRFQSDDARLGDLDGDGDLDLVLVLDGNPDFPGVTSGTNRPLRVFENK
jgi:hypothetical protein